MCAGLTESGATSLSPTDILTTLEVVQCLGPAFFANHGRKYFLACVACTEMVLQAIHVGAGEKACLEPGEVERNRGVIAARRILVIAARRILVIAARRIILLIVLLVRGFPATEWLRGTTVLLGKEDAQELLMRHSQQDQRTQRLQIGDSLHELYLQVHPVTP
jgi:hypothetical protein